MTKLTITGRAETILGILQKLEICDAKWNVNEGFTVALDTTDPEPGSDSDQPEAVKSSPKKPGRRKKMPEPEPEPEKPAKKGIIKTCRLCGNEFTAPGGNTRYCPECRSMHGNRCGEIEEQLKKNGGKGSD